MSWHQHANKWRAITTIDKEQKILGHYVQEEDAARAVLDEMMNAYPQADWDALWHEFFPGITATTMMRTTTGVVPSGNHAGIQETEPC